VAEAFLWGASASSTLLLGAAAAYVFRPGVRLVALVLAIGAGLLMGSVSFSLVGDALEEGDLSTVAVALMLGAVTFVAGDWWLDRRGAEARKDPGGAQAGEAGRSMWSAFRHWAREVSVAVGSMSALLMTTMSAISTIPFLIAWRSSPAFGSWSRQNMSTMPATVVSDWPTPTVSTMITS